MKKIILTATLLLSVATFAQKDELKTLKKIYSKDEISEKDLEAYKTASDALQGLASEESDKVYAKFYKVMYPTVVLASKGPKATTQDQTNLYNPEFIQEYGATIDETIAFEKKSGKKVYTDELLEEKKMFKKNITSLGLLLNTEKRFKEASVLFYSLYLFDKKSDLKLLQNAGILAVQGEDFKSALKYYTEYSESNYLNTGIVFYAVNKETGAEEEFASKEERDKLVSFNLYHKARDYKVSEEKPEIFRILALLYKQNNDFENAKATYTKARLLDPNNEELKKGEFELYFSIAVSFLVEEDKLIKEINDSVSDKKKYNELIEKRKLIFMNSIPYLEKAYSINPKDESTFKILKAAYEITGQSEKAKSMN